MLKHVSLLVFVAGLAGMAAANANESAPAADPAAFTQKLAACGACHGEKGDKPLAPDYPVLAGQHADFLAQALRSYQRGASGAPASANVRKNAIMGAFAKQLSKQDIENVSAWLAAQPGPLAVRR